MSPKHDETAFVTHQRLFQSLFVALLVVVTVLSLLPIDHPSAAPNDKINHLLAWGALGTTLGLGWPGRRWPFAALLGFSVLIEILQGMTGYRMFSLADGLANALGIGGAIVLLWLWYKVPTHKKLINGKTRRSRNDAKKT